MVHKSGIKELSPTTDHNLVVSLMHLMDANMEEFHSDEKITQLDEREIVMWLECIFLFSFTWSIAATCDQSG
ncbi:unnamed protein product, partial [Lymnaea stagnalis]